MEWNCYSHIRCHIAHLSIYVLPRRLTTPSAPLDHRQSNTFASVFIVRSSLDSLVRRPPSTATCPSAPHPHRRGISASPTRECHLDISISLNFCRLYAICTRRSYSFQTSTLSRSSCILEPILRLELPFVCGAANLPQISLELHKSFVHVRHQCLPCFVSRNDLIHFVPIPHEPWERAPLKIRFLRLAVIRRGRARFSLRFISTRSTCACGGRGRSTLKCAA
ncbi:hypothetical protein C8R45DRAFT_596919 [Mycena sanguinolenta]|nr:hypothetical protein C8R45DRAFT_596919 [Mycena sanguinolenta]